MSKQLVTKVTYNGEEVGRWWVFDKLKHDMQWSEERLESFEHDVDTLQPGESLMVQMQRGMASFHRFYRSKSATKSRTKDGTKQKRAALLREMTEFKEAAESLLAAWNDYENYTGDRDFAIEEYPFPEDFDEVCANIKDWVNETN